MEREQPESNVHARVRASSEHSTRTLPVVLYCRGMTVTCSAWRIVSPILLIGARTTGRTSLSLSALRLNPLVNVSQATLRNSFDKKNLILQLLRLLGKSKTTPMVQCLAGCFVSTPEEDYRKIQIWISSTWCSICRSRQEHLIEYLIGVIGVEPELRTSPSTLGLLRTYFENMPDPL